MFTKSGVSVMVKKQSTELVDCLVTWSGTNNPVLNINITNTMIIDFKRNWVKSITISIMGEGLSNLNTSEFTWITD